jgi:hypothetical protein
MLLEAFADDRLIVDNQDFFYGHGANARCGHVASARARQSREFGSATTRHFTGRIG